MSKGKGFTLIELLIVIAIIGILGTIVLTSLNSARDKARDASIKSALSSIRTKAEVYNTVNGNYSDATVTECDADDSIFDAGEPENVFSLVAKIMLEKGNDPGDFDGITCGADANGWVVGAELINDSGVTWCADGNGNNRAGTPDTTDMECD